MPAGAGDRETERAPACSTGKPAMAHSTNLILEALPASERQTLSPLLRPDTLRQHEILFESRQLMERIYFPFDAVVSLVVTLTSGEAIETAMVGHDGIVGAAAAVNGRVSLNRGVVEIAGVCLSCEAHALRRVLPQCSTLVELISRHEQVLFAQAQQSAACNVCHPIGSRLARWLLRARDMCGSDQLDLTQESMAEMLGVRRTTVSLTAHTLQKAGLISYRRGHIKIENVDGLKEVSCECYEAVRLHYATLQHASSNE